MSRATLSNVSMLELFRQEVETQTAILSDALLALERDPAAAGNIEELMRAAHSIKGAARIVERADAVKLAHEMEDTFIGVQQGRIRLDAALVDRLLRDVDALARLARSEEEPVGQMGQIGPMGQDEPPHTSHPSHEAHPTHPPALFDVFRSEVVAQCEAVRTELASLGEAPQARQLDALRGAIDAIGGSARLLRIEPLARFAAVASKAVLTNAAGAAGPLTRATDVLLSIDAAGDVAAWLPLHLPLIEEVTRAFDATAAPAAARPAPKPVVKPAIEAAPAKAAEAPAKKAREIRITADKLDRLMAATGETTVAARWFDGFARSLTRLKAQQEELLATIEKGELLDIHMRAAECRAVLMQRLDECETFSRQLENLSGRLYREVIATRMRPFSAGVHPFPRLVRDLARTLGKKAELQIDGASTEVDREILDKLDAPLTHILRNAMDHGMDYPDQRLEAGKSAEGCVRIEASHQHGMLQVRVEDDGRGIDVEKIRAKILERGLAGPEIVSRLSEPEILEFLFLPGFSTASAVTEISGRGVGLDAVQSMAQEVGGQVRVETRLGQGTTFILQLPITRAVVRALLVEVAGEPYAVPLSRIERALLVPAGEVRVAEGREYIQVDGATIGIISGRQLLGIAGEAVHDHLPIIVLSNQRNRYGIAVDRFMGESDLVLRPLDARLGKVPNVSAVSVTLDGTPILLLDVDDVVVSVDELLNGGALRRTLEAARAASAAPEKRRKRVLVVDDSLTVREVERRLLENQGYEVDVAVDGMNGWNAVRSAEYDLVISDVDMPRMTGIELVSRIKQDERLARIPVMIVSYKDREEDRLRGLDAGANYYLTKSSFQDDTMLRVVADLIGPAA